MARSVAAKTESRVITVAGAESQTPQHKLSIRVHESRMRLFTALAVLVLLIHLFWLVWILSGWIVTRHRPWLGWLHIGSLLWGIWAEVGPWPCPLTILEQMLERHAGSASYRGSFMIHYLEAIIYPDVPPQLLTWVGSAVCVAILAIHGRRFWHDRGRGGSVRQT